VLAREGLDAGSISFVIEIFSAGLLTVGAYLLNRYRRLLSEADERAAVVSDKIQLVGPFVVSGPTASLIGGYLLSTDFCTLLLRVAAEDSDKVLSSCVVHTRDYLGELETELKLATQRRRGIAPARLDDFKDQARRIKKKLENLPPKAKNGITDLDRMLEQCDKIIGILQSGDFERRYRDQEAVLLGAAKRVLIVNSGQAVDG
jgi:hypothetical protein